MSHIPPNSAAGWRMKGSGGDRLAESLSWKTIIHGGCGMWIHWFDLSAFKQVFSQLQKDLLAQNSHLGHPSSPGVPKSKRHFAHNRFHINSPCLYPPLPRSLRNAGVVEVPTFAEEVGGHLDDTGNLWAFQCVQNCQAVLNRMGFHMKEVSHEASAKTTRMNVFPVESQAGPSNYLVSLRMPHGRT